jgi:hypothetical protein
VTGLQGMAVKSRHLGYYPSYSRLGALSPRPVRHSPR